MPVLRIDGDAAAPWLPRARDVKEMMALSQRAMHMLHYAARQPAAEICSDEEY